MSIVYVNFYNMIWDQIRASCFVKKGHKFTEAQLFVFIFEQSAQLFCEIFYKTSTTKAAQKWREIQIKKCFTQ